MSRKQRLLAAPYGLWIIICTILPLLFILGYALSTESGTFTFDNLLAIFEPIHIKSLILSLKMSLITTVICLVLAYPVALILHNASIKRKSLVVFLFILPMWMNFMLRILAWKIILSNNGLLNLLLGALHLPTQHILYTKASVILGMVYDFLPYMILPVYNAMSRIDKDYIEAAKDLGAGSFTVFSRIVFPLSKTGVISGIIMVFVPALSSFIVSNVLGGGKVLLIGNVIEQEFTLARDWNTGSGLSIILMIFVLLAMGITQKMDNTGEGGVLL